MSTDTLTYVLSCLRRSSENAYPWSLTPNEAGLLVAEIERLRGERAAVVAWLREVAERMDWDGERCCGRVEDLVSAVERGEHRRIDPTKDLQELHAVTREAGVTHAAVSAAANDYIRGNVTFSYLVERLRELTLAAAEKIATQRHDDHIMDVQHAHDEGIAEGERRERAAVVAYLRTRPGYGPVADIIERGEHRREEAT